jgi:hypothetical protein
MLSSFWQWLQEAPSVFWQCLHDTTPGQATFLGSVFGFLALLCGAWANASFNRRRDDRLRKEDQRAVVTALRAELKVLRLALNDHAETLKKVQPDEGFLTPDLSNLVRIMPEMISKLGLLDQETIQSVMDAYGLAGEPLQKVADTGWAPSAGPLPRH